MRKTILTSMLALTLSLPVLAQSTFTIEPAPMPEIGGTVTCSPLQVPAGGTVTCTATPAPGYYLENWFFLCEVDQNNVCRIHNVLDDTWVPAIFSEFDESLKIREGPNADKYLRVDVQNVDGMGWDLVTAYTDTTASVGTPPPPGIVLPYGLLHLTLSSIHVGTRAYVTITYPEPLPPGTRYYKYGRPTVDQDPQWYPFDDVLIDGNTITLSITDGRQGDEDWESNGEITDPGGPVFPISNVSTVPSLQTWVMWLLALLIGGSALTHHRRRSH